MSGGSSGLLRGQLGTDDATAAGAEAGAHLVVLDDAVQAAGLLASEAGLVLNWRVGPAGSDLSGANFSDHSETGGLRALLPLSPVHLRAAKDGAGDVRSPGPGAGASTPTAGRRATFRSARSARNTRSRSRMPAEPWCGPRRRPRRAFVYDSADIAADFGAPPAEIDVTVRQLSLAAGWGLPATRRLSLA